MFILNRRDEMLNKKEKKRLESALKSLEYDAKRIDPFHGKKYTRK